VSSETILSYWFLFCSRAKASSTIRCSIVTSSGQFTCFFRSLNDCRSLNGFPEIGSLYFARAPVTTQIGTLGSVTHQRKTMIKLNSNNGSLQTKEKASTNMVVQLARLQEHQEQRSPGRTLSYFVWPKTDHCHPVAPS